MRADATTKHVAIDCAVPRTLPAVRADRVHVSQVLLNLLMNAIEAVTAHAGPQRRVSIEAHVGADGCCEVSVSDTGPGIPPDQLDRIFERFYRIDPARHRSTGGTGLGLSIVKHVAATHGGEIRVWSVEGQGFTFTLTLPRANQEVPT